MARTLKVKSLSGLTLTARLLVRDSDTIVEAVSLTEMTNTLGTYTGAIGVGTAAGIYEVVLLSGSDHIGNGEVRIDAGNGTYRVDQVITSATFDETTAFPVTSTDSGSTRIARTGADSDTLETLSDQIDSIGGAAEIVVSASSSVLDAVDSGGTITLRRGDRMSFSLTVGSVTGRTGEKLFFTVKSRATNDSTDSNAILQVTETTGACIVNGASYATATDASITVTDQSTGAMTIVVKSAIMDDLPVGDYVYDVQMIRSDSEPTTLTYGVLKVVADVTRRTTLS